MGDLLVGSERGVCEQDLGDCPKVLNALGLVQGPRVGDWWKACPRTRVHLSARGCGNCTQGSLSASSGLHASRSGGAPERVALPGLPKPGSSPPTRLRSERRRSRWQLRPGAEGGRSGASCRTICHQMSPLPRRRQAQTKAARAEGRADPPPAHPKPAPLLTPTAPRSPNSPAPCAGKVPPATPIALTLHFSGLSAVAGAHLGLSPDSGLPCFVQRLKLGSALCSPGVAGWVIRW